MNYKEPTIKQLFPLSYNKKLLDIQSTQFLNNSISKGKLSAGFDDLITHIPEPENLEKDVIKNNISKSFIGTYFKNNWKVMLLCLITGGVIIYVSMKTSQKKKTKS